jgi:rubredoxin
MGFKDTIVFGIKEELGFKEINAKHNCTNCKYVHQYSMCEPLCARNPEFKFTVSDNNICNKFKYYESS